MVAGFLAPAPQLEVRLGSARLRVIEPEGDKFEEKSGNIDPLPLSAALMKCRAGSLGEVSLSTTPVSLITLGSSGTVLCRTGLNLGDTMLGEGFMNIEVAALIELGAGVDGALCALLIRGRLVALDGAGSTAWLELPPFNMVDNEPL